MNVQIVFFYQNICAKFTFLGFSENIKVLFEAKVNFAGCSSMGINSIFSIGYIWPPALTLYCLFIKNFLLFAGRLWRSSSTAKNRRQISTSWHSFTRHQMRVTIPARRLHENDLLQTVAQKHNGCEIEDNIRISFQNLLE